MNGLKFHWSNPKFDGLPWPADRAEKKPSVRGVTQSFHDVERKKKPRCCKLVRSQQDAQRECSDLRSSDAGSDWFYRFCSECNGFHVYRVRKA